MAVTVMIQLTGFLLFWVTGIAGYWLFRICKLPAPSILGPILCFILLALAGYKPVVPIWMKPALSIMTGILLGMRFNFELKGGGKLLLAGVWIAVLSLLTAYILTLLGADRETALFAAAPGGMAEITLLSLSYGADHFAIVLLQAARLICSMTVFPLITPGNNHHEESTLRTEPGSGRFTWYQAGGICTIGLISAWVVSLFHIPAAGIIGPMLAVGLVVKSQNIKYSIPTKLQVLIQIGIGGLAGTSISRDSIIGFRQYVIPILVLNFFVIGGSLLFSKILMYMTDWDKATCMLSCCPAGLSPTIMLAMDYGADANIVTAFQVMRMVTVLFVTPIAAKLLL